MQRIALFVLPILLVTACIDDSESPDGGCDGGTCLQNPTSTGDVGTSCDPMASTTSCAGSCLALSDGSGVCVDSCGAGGHALCPDGYKCNTLPRDDGTTQNVCLPNASCGDLTYQGFCEGADLHYCGTEGPLVVNCAEHNGENGQPLQCAVVNDAIGANCVSSSFTGGCGNETEQGRCDGNTVVYCESVASGNVLRRDCGSDVCGVSASGIAECRAPGTEGCGNVTYQGFCDGAAAVWCQDSAVQRHDCAGEGKSCGWIDDMTGYFCVDAMSMGGSNRVRGTFMFEKREITTEGLGNARPAPIRHAKVRVISAADNSTLASSYTDTNGAFDIAFDGSGDVYVAVFTAVETAEYGITVRDCPEGTCDDGGSVYAARSADLAASPSGDVGTLTVQEATGTAGAFNVFDLFIKGFDFARANFGRTPPALTGQWRKGSNTSCSTSCFSGRSNTIFVLGTPNDTDEFDDPVLLHEFGHFMEASFSRGDSPGGSHDGSPTDPRLAWGEGYGTFVGAAIAGSSLYIDTRASGAGATDINDTGVTAGGGGMRQLVSEYMVAEGLWRISASQTTPPIFDVLGNYFTGNSLADRGVEGVDFVDFLDGWFCRGHAQRQAIESIVNQHLQFPYDYAGPGGC